MIHRDLQYVDDGASGAARDDKSQLLLCGAHRTCLDSLDTKGKRDK